MGWLNLLSIYVTENPVGRAGFHLVYFSSKIYKTNGQTGARNTVLIICMMDIFKLILKKENMNPNSVMVSEQNVYFTLFQQSWAGRGGYT